MKLKWIGALVALSFGLGLWSGLQAADLKQPLDPKVLLQTLPKQIGTLKVVASNGDVTLENWLKSRATRTFEGTKEVEGVQVPVNVSLTLTDTAFDRQSLGEFVDFQPLKVENYEKKVLGGNPATILQNGEQQVDVKVLFFNRFILELSLPADQLEKVEEWIQRVPANALKAVETPSFKAYPSQVVLSYIDELDPSNNRSYESTVPSPELQKKHLEELAELEKTGVR